MKGKSKWSILAALLCAGALYGGISWIAADSSQNIAAITAGHSGCTRTSTSSSESNGFPVSGCTAESTMTHSSTFFSIPSAVIPAASSQQPDYELSRDEHVQAAEGIGESRDPNSALQTLVLAKMCAGYDEQKKIEMKCNCIVPRQALSLQVLQNASDAGDKNASMDLARALLFDETASSRAKSMALLVSIKQDNPAAQRLYAHLVE